MRRLPNHHGISIVDFLVGCGIASIIVLATVSLVYNQTSQLRTIMQNRDAAELHKAMLASMANSENCTCLLNPSRNVIYEENLHFDSRLPTAGRIDLHEFFSDCDAQKHPMTPIAVVGQSLPGSDSSLKVSDVAVENIKCTKGPQSCTGVITVKFDPGTSKVAIHPISILEQFTIDNRNPHRASIVECGGIIQGSASIGDGSSLSSWPLAIGCSCEGTSLLYHMAASFKNGQQAAIPVATGMSYLSSAVSYSNEKDDTGTSAGRVRQAIIYYDRSGNFVVGPGTACKYSGGKAIGVPSCPTPLHLDGRQLEF